MHTTTQHPIKQHPDKPATAYWTIAGVAAIAGSLLLLASTIAYVVADEGMNDGDVGGIIMVWAFIALGVAGVGLARRLEPYTPLAAAVLSLLVIVGTAAGVGYGIDSIHVDVVGSTSLQDVDGAAGPLALQIPGIVFPIAFAALGVLLARTGAAPRVLGIALAIGSVLFPAARIPDIEAVALVGDAVLVLALVPLGAWLAGWRVPALAGDRRPAGAPA